MEAAVQASAVASKRVVFVGGLADGANVSLLRAAMIPFGPIASVDMVGGEWSSLYDSLAFFKVYLIVSDVSFVLITANGLC